MLELKTSNTDERPAADAALRRIAVLIPCLNEAATVARVVADFKQALPQADIYVYDNGSDDGTAAVAAGAGAEVRRVKARGKGNVVREMFREVEADYFLMVDGDATYPAGEAERLLRPVLDGDCDMAVGRRTAVRPQGAFPKFHRLGNSIVSRLVNFFFRSKVEDVFSGYRAFNRKTVKMLPLLSSGFEVETEMTLQALDKGFSILEIEVPYYQRPEGSHSKLKTYLDGLLVLKTIFFIVKDYRPLLVFSLAGLVSFLGSLILGSFVISEFLRTEKVSHPSTAVLAASLMIVALLAVATGLVLDTIKRHFAELYLLSFNQRRDTRPHGT